MSVGAQIPQGTVQDVIYVRKQQKAWSLCSFYGLTACAILSLLVDRILSQIPSSLLKWQNDAVPFNVNMCTQILSRNNCIFELFVNNIWQYKTARILSILSLEMSLNHTFDFVA